MPTLVARPGVVDTDRLAKLSPSAAAAALQKAFDDVMSAKPTFGRDVSMRFEGCGQIVIDRPIVVRSERDRSVLGDRAPVDLLHATGLLALKTTGKWDSGVVTFDGVRPAMAGFALTVRNPDNEDGPLWAVKFCVSDIHGKGGNTWGVAPHIETEGGFQKAALLLEDAECLHFNGGVFQNSLGPALRVQKRATMTAASFQRSFFDSRKAPNVVVLGGVEDVAMNDCNFTVCRDPILAVGSAVGVVNNIVVEGGRVERYDETGKPLDALDTDLVEVINYCHGLRLKGLHLANAFRSVRIVRAARYDDFEVDLRTRGRQCPVRAPKGTVFNRAVIAETSRVEMFEPVGG